MSAIENLAARIYAESDFGRGVATSIAGAVGLLCYLLIDDWVIAAFCSMISFPVARIAATEVHRRRRRRADSDQKREVANERYKCLGEEEKKVVRAFVDAGGSVLTWSNVNKLARSGPAIESLIQRGLMWASVTADGMTETFVLDSVIFDACRRSEP